jgi:hypothetical protein
LELELYSLNIIMERLDQTFNLVQELKVFLLIKRDFNKQHILTMFYLILGMVCQPIWVPPWLVPPL